MGLTSRVPPNWVPEAQRFRFPFVCRFCKANFIRIEVSHALDRQTLRAELSLVRMLMLISERFARMTVGALMIQQYLVLRAVRNYPRNLSGANAAQVQWHNATATEKVVRYDPVS